MTRNGEDVTGNCCPWQGKRIKPGSRVALNLQSRSPKAVIASQNRTPLIFGRAICRTRFRAWLCFTSISFSLDFWRTTEQDLSENFAVVKSCV